ncbi:hypothetical protein HU727_021560 [Pseudomonas sp. SWRI153]|uniref:Uncharacterized protein n=1 Tax=Pseudomonas khorasanensis TaxID=2745508 RepID=A0A923F827_9PSED|nr:hypothetical protein [Pseudomonas khorasanensis]MBV4488175.1 hypothetical protein [Pseudomonas khorasanensis]
MANEPHLIIRVNNVAASDGTMKGLNPTTHQWNEPDFAFGPVRLISSGIFL